MRIKDKTKFMTRITDAIIWLANSLLGKQKKEVLFIQVLQMYLDKYIQEEDLEWCTIEKNQYLLTNIQNFLRSQKLTQLRADQVKIKHMEDLKLWLHKNLDKCKLSHSARHLSLCRRALKFAVQAEIIKYNVLESMEIKRDRYNEVIHMEWEEYLKLVRSHWDSEIYQIVRDLYVFQCNTGLSYADLYKFKVIRDKKGKEWIIGQRSKNDNHYEVPFMPVAKAIYERYDNGLPFIANQTYNRIIKEIAMALNIDKKLTTHTARKTFGTFKFDDGHSSDVIKQMLGQKSVITTEKHYQVFSRKRIEKEMTALSIVH